MKNSDVTAFERLFPTAAARTQYVQNLFTQIAPRYDLLNRVMSLGRDQYWRKLAIRKAQFPAGSQILDLGCGSGDMTASVLQQVPQSQVLGYDNCRDLLALGSQKTVFQKNSGRIRWLIGDGRFLPFRDHCFDGVVAAFSVRNIPNRPQLLPELFRVIRPGGKIVILDMVQPSQRFFRWIFKFHFQYIVPVLGKWLGSDPAAYRYLYPSIVNFYSTQELKNILYATGCTQVSVHEFMFRTVALGIGTK
ncbi:ubiquinone/menaquinone biosynthesis methyltransferase [candidate division KSB1 bacterium]|nr:ubiquinone/menaquinone biosynthesis methyltransferase [candidate division KSB1 bacterium]